MAKRRIIRSNGKLAMAFFVSRSRNSKRNSDSLFLGASSWKAMPPAPHQCVAERFPTLCKVHVWESPFSNFLKKLGFFPSRVRPCHRHKISFSILLSAFFLSLSVLLLIYYERKIVEINKQYFAYALFMQRSLCAACDLLNFK